MHQRIKDKVVKDVTIHCRNMLLGLVNMKIHVHGLVLHDVVAMLEKDINDKSLDYIQKYFHQPFDVFREKILHVFDGQDIRLNDMMREKFDTDLIRMKQSLQSDLQASHEKSLTEVMCQNQFIRLLGIGEKNFTGIAMPNFNESRPSRLKKRKEDEEVIIEKLVNLIMKTNEVSTDITKTQQDGIKKKAINDVNNHLFLCTKLCPLCQAPCNETHSEGDGQHSSGCHRPQGIATYVERGNDEFVTLCCNDLIKSDQTFSNPYTYRKRIAYKDYKSVNNYYASWSIKAVPSAATLYWKFITYQVTKNLNRFFPGAKKPNVRRWGAISKREAITNINSLFHLNEVTIAKNEEGFHIIKSSESLKPTIKTLNIKKNQPDRENMKQLFKLISKEEVMLTNVAKQITKVLLQRIKDNVVEDVTVHCKNLLLRLVNQRIQVHGLVLHDVVAMLEKDISNENVDYIRQYFQHPFDVFREKISHVFDGYQDIRLNDMIGEKFGAALRRMRQSLQANLQASHEKSLIEVICQNQSFRWLSIEEKDFSGIVMTKFIKAPAFRLNLSATSLPDNDRLMIENQVRKRMEDENNIMKKLTNLITETNEVSTDITVDQQDKIKKKVINDVNNHLFLCTKFCPLCHSPCDQTHPEEEDGLERIHSSRHHRPQGIAAYVRSESREFVTSFCNDLIKSNHKFRNDDTKDKLVAYSNYRNVNSYYKSWNIEAVEGGDKLYWKYITYQVTNKLHQLFPKAKKSDVTQWVGISKGEAIRNINSLFHIDGITIARNEDGFHVIPSLEKHAK